MTPLVPASRLPSLLELRHPVRTGLGNRHSDPFPGLISNLSHGLDFRLIAQPRPVAIPGFLAALASRPRVRHRLPRAGRSRRLPAGERTPYPLHPRAAVPAVAGLPIDACVHARWTQEHRPEHWLPVEECSGMSRVATMFRTTGKSRALMNRSQPAVIASASGMATGGRVLHHLKALAPDLLRNAIMFADCQVHGTPDGRIIAGERRIRIHREDVAVNAESAHDAFLADPGSLRSEQPASSRNATRSAKLDAAVLERSASNWEAFPTFGRSRALKKLALRGQVASLVAPATAQSSTSLAAFQKTSLRPPI
jgi:hypothetical protein